MKRFAKAAGKVLAKEATRYAVGLGGMRPDQLSPGGKVRRIAYGYAQFALGFLAVSKCWESAPVLAVAGAAVLGRGAVKMARAKWDLNLL